MDSLPCEITHLFACSEKISFKFIGTPTNSEFPGFSEEVPVLPALPVPARFCKPHFHPPPHLWASQFPSEWTVTCHYQITALFSEPALPPVYLFGDVLNTTDQSINTPSFNDSKGISFLTF